ncbi:MAG: hypothetical protein H6737_22390 [Alphaproteobacteria bacterium]|nr:hypothetical protein [Alphaproteobacteria bacterium]
MSWAALRRLDEDRPVEALEALLADWERCRAPGLADRILRLGRLLSGALPAITGPHQHDRWMEVAARQHPADIDRLVAVAGMSRGATHRAVKQRFDRLAERVPDPRTTRLIGAWAHKLPSGSSAGRIAWTAFFRLVAHTGDPRAREPLEELLARARQALADSRHPQWADFERYLIDRVPKALALVPDAAECEPLEAVDAALDALEARGPVPEAAFERRTDASIDQLAAQVLEDPTSDGALAVWADALIEAGDPRGPFVTLQLARERGEGGKAERTLERKLLKAHRNTWLGPLDPVVDSASARFRRGLLDAATVRFRSREQHALIDRPEWHSVTRIHTTTAHLLAPSTPNVRALGMRLVPDDDDGIRGPEGWVYDPKAPVPPWTQLVELGSCGRPLPWHTVTFGLPRTDPSPQHLAQAGESPALASVSTVHVVDVWGDFRRWDGPQGPDRFGPLARLPLLRRASVLVIDNFSSAPSGVMAWLALGGPHVEKVVVLHDPQTAFELRPGPHVVISRFGSAGFIPDWLRQQSASRARSHMRRWLQTVLPEPGACASIRVRCRPLPADELAVFTGHFAPCPSVELPPEKKRR